MAVPVQVRPLLERCLQKEQKKRLRAIGDWELLVNVGAGHVPPGIAHGRPLSWAVAGTLAIIALVLGALLWRATRPVEQPLKPLVRLDVDLGADVSLKSN